MPRAYPFERYVLVSSPNKFSNVTGEFAEELGLSEAARAAYERHLERIARRKVADFSAERLLAATGRPALLMHSSDDFEVAHVNAEEIAAACPKAELKTFDGLGHRNILFAPPVIRAAIGYLTQS
jgi:pimeloyl-ACP methyl ester carboxylesterase